MTTPVFLGVRGSGAISLTPCPGRFDTLENDVGVIATAKVGLMLSLIETAEQPATVDRLPKLLAENGIAWKHWAITDFGIPSEAAERTWPDIAHDIHNMLDRGGRVLVHCWGGLGRSGMIVLRILMERGEPGEEALHRLRAVRPGAIETGAQLAWAQAGRLREGPIADQMDDK